MALPVNPLSSSHSLGSWRLYDLLGFLRYCPGVGLEGEEFFELDRRVGCPHSFSIHQYPPSVSPCPTNEHLLLLVGLEHLEAPHLVLSGLNPTFGQVGGACQPRDRSVAFGVERALDRFRDGDKAPVLYMGAAFDQMKEVEHSGSYKCP